ncbi:hypothetical protein F4212_14120 [Candidatus Poribacteria bacterium]|nr:hypothetical protein [Candidatus Poribacteria bacterium]
MKLYQRFFILGSGLFTFFCFWFPWLDNESGHELAGSKGTGFIAWVFVASIVIIGCTLFWQSRFIILTCCYISLFILMLLFFHDIFEFDIVNWSLFRVDYGIFLAAIGFFLTIAGVRFFPKTEDNFESIREKYYPKTTDNTEPVDEQDDEANAKGEEE